MAGQIVTLNLPDSIYRVAQQVAAATRQPLDQVLQASIAHALPPLDDLPLDQAADLAGMALLADGALWQAARSQLEDGEQVELQDLLELQAGGELSADQLRRLETLLDRYGEATVRKAHAYLLLARRGYRVPMQDAQS